MAGLTLDLDLDSSSLNQVDRPIQSRAAFSTWAFPRRRHREGAGPCALLPAFLALPSLLEDLPSPGYAPVLVASHFWTLDDFLRLLFSISNPS